MCPRRECSPKEARARLPVNARAFRGEIVESEAVVLYQVLVLAVTTIIVSKYDMFMRDPQT